MSRRRKYFIYSFATLITLTTIIIFIWPSQKLSLFPFVSEGLILNATSTSVEQECKIPSISPWHPSLLPLIEHPRQVVCRRVQPDLTYLDENGTLHLNMSAVGQFELEEQRLKKLTSVPKMYCRYAYFDRGHIDRKIVFESESLLNGSIQLTKNFIRVVCNLTFEVNNTISTKLAYVNLHAHPISNDNENRSLLSDNGDDMNVFLFMLESTSSSMFRRHLPLTYDYLTQNMSTFAFNSVLKVGENTLPNLAALFTSLRLRREQDNMLPELENASRNGGFYDHWPFIWKRFSREAGYTTTYLEDSTQISTFHYGEHGFRKKPIDYWYFPFWEALRLIELPKKSTNFCFGNRPIYQIFNDILLRHLTSDDWIRKRQFLFSIFSDLSHDYACDLERGDSSWKEFFQKLQENDRFNRTILIIAGDHGPRFTSIRASEAGFVEERVPFFAIRLPPWFLKRYPSVEKNLQINRDRLTTMFDLHRTLVDILESRFSPEDSAVPLSTPSERGLSLLRELPSNRTCYEAGTPDRYCLCNGIQIEKIDHQLALRSAALILDVAQNVTEQYRDRCVKIKVEKILYFIRVGQNGEDLNSTKNHNFIETYFLAFKSEPLGGIFEGAVWYDLRNDTIVFKNGTLERINRFGGICVPTTQLKKFCACKEYVDKLKPKL